MLRGRGAFTLAELLVVIAILSILAAMLFPVVITAKQTAHRSSCANNFGQIGMALLMYVGDNNGRFPATMAGVCPTGLSLSDFDGNYPGVAGLTYALYRYAKSPQLWMCATGPRREWGSRVHTTPRDLPVSRSWYLVSWVHLPNGRKICTNYMSFPFNRHDGLSHEGQDHSPECAQGRTPEEYYELCGRVWSTGHVWGRYRTGKMNGRILQDPYKDRGDNIFWNHKGGTNVLYYDGRTAWITDPNMQ